MASLLQRYSISVPPGEDPKVEFNRGMILINQIKPFNVILKKRI